LGCHCFAVAGLQCHRPLWYTRRPRSWKPSSLVARQRHTVKTSSESIEASLVLSVLVQGYAGKPCINNESWFRSSGCFKYLDMSLLSAKQICLANVKGSNTTIAVSALVNINFRLEFGAGGCHRSWTTLSVIFNSSIVRHDSPKWWGVLLSCSLSLCNVRQQSSWWIISTTGLFQQFVRERLEQARDQALRRLMDGFLDVTRLVL
jgi:hypothetical protein